MLAAALKLLPLFLMVLPGAMAALLLSELDRSDEVFPRLIAEYAPVGLKGLMIAGLMAAIMSSIDSALNSASTLISVDFVQTRSPGIGVQKLARIGRYSTLALVAVAALWAPAIDRFPGLFAYLQQGFAYLASPLVGTLLLALYCREVGASAAFYGTLSGHALSLALFVGSLSGWMGLHFTIVAGVLAAATALAGWVGSRLLDEHAQRAPPRGEPVPKAIAWTAAGIVVLTLALVISFW